MEVDLICFNETCIYNDAVNNICSHGEPCIEMECERACRCVSYEERDTEEEYGLIS